MPTKFCHHFHLWPPAPLPTPFFFLLQTKKLLLLHMAASPVTAVWNVRTSHASFYLPPVGLQAGERESPTVPQPSTAAPDTTAFYAQDSGEEASTTQLAADLMIQFRNVIYAADDLVDELPTRRCKNKLSR